MMDHESRDRALKFMAVVALAIFGGVIGYMSRAAESNEPVTIGTLIVQAAGAGFAGVLIFLAGSLYDIDWRLIAIVSGIGGWMGADATLRLMSKWARRKIGDGSSSK